MKKILLTLTVFAAGFMAHSQVVCSGVSPAAIQGNYDFTWAEPGTDWSCPDFLIPGTFVEDTLMIVDDGTPGLNPQGNPMSAEACNGPLINDLTGKIAVIYRNTCEFGYKALQAENAGAVAVIIINREDALVTMGGGVEGINVTIPVVFISSLSGLTLTNEMANGPVVMLLGNKVGAYPNDVGANNGQMLVSPYGGANDLQYDGFEPGIQVYNFGSLDQANVTVNAKIDGPNGNVYDQTVGPINMLSGDTLSIFPGNTDFFPAWAQGIGNYDIGMYTLTYTLDMGVPDDSDFDNVFTSSFSITDGIATANAPGLDRGILALSNVDGGGMPIANNYPSNATTEYQSCFMVQEPNASVLAVQGMYFVPHTDTSVNSLAGAEIFANAYQWDDTWTDLDDPSVDWSTLAGMNTAFDNLNLITFGTHYPASDDDVDDVAYIPFATPFVLIDNQRYLFCLQTFESATISFGYDNTINYDGNEGIFRQPTSPVHVDGQWYTGGWSGVSAPSISLKTFPPAELGVEDLSTVEGSAFPNPANDVVTLSIEANGPATLKVTDMAGKVAMNNGITLVDGSVKVDVSSLESGIYTFNVTLENGQTSQFNVVKK